MQINALATVFFSVLLAELGDKTQLATMCFAAEGECSPLGVFLASAAALVFSSLLAVLVGSQINRFVPASYIKLAAGLGFVLIGLWVVRGAFKA
ncbi:MAG: TMEM165/GDT1 family protein [Thermodesulfobacteriota bacterium]